MLFLCFCVITYCFPVFKSLFYHHDTCKTENYTLWYVEGRHHPHLTYIALTTPEKNGVLLSCGD